MSDKRSYRAKVLGVQLASVVAAFSLLEFIARESLIPSAVLAPPSAAFIAMLSLLGNPTAQAQIGNSLTTLAIAFGLAVFVGLYLGMAIGAVKALKLSFEPLFVAFLSIPKVLFVTIFWTLFGFGFLYQMLFAFIHGVIPIVLSVIAGMALVDKNFLKVADVYGASRFQLFQKVYTPAIAFVLLGSLRIAFNLSLVGLILAEYFVGTSGIGYALRQYAGTFQMANYFAMVFVILILSVAVNLTLLWVERKIAAQRGIGRATR